MKMTSDKMRAMALRHGGTAVIDGKVFNSGRETIAPKPAALPEPAPEPVAALPVPPAPVAPAPQVDTFTRTEVEALLREQSDRFERRLADAMADRDDDSVRAVGFTPTYGPDGEILDVGVRYERIQ